ncbi:Inner membrane protein YedI [Marinomonas spartinae]|uniref:DUF808 domain-containing protein n=1 Tax=Marinomonas spartinae TaxID=1792290 RepID=UPI00080916A6|nr:DUF808 domain-containing protein [Marinomonas spartinae]SBS40191.1 Inner membrane protein YedI [Marinomonas spartinae]
MSIGLLALLDDITTLLDDIAVLSKVAAKKTVGVLGDDLALNAEQVSGFSADRELPVVWAVAKGSLVNKAILVPLAIAVSAFLPWLIQPILMLGGLYLCYEGAEKVLHSIKQRRHKKTHQQSVVSRLTAQIKQTEPKLDEEALKKQEKIKVKGAIRTDFVLSAEIIVIALGTVENQSILIQALVVSVIAFVVTVGVYALVGLIVRLDDIGLALFKSKHTLVKTTGNVILQSAPWLIRLLTVVGTVAMFLVGGGIFVHGLPLLHGIEHAISSSHALSSSFLTGTLGVLFNIFIGLVLGGVAIAIASPFNKEEAH